MTAHGGTLQASIKAVFFDMDSTVIAEETLPILAREVGLEAKIAKITERAMAGELDFTTALRERVALLKGIPLDIVAKLADKVTLNPGIEEFARAAEYRGVRCYLVSGGFYPLVGILAGRLMFAGSAGNRFKCDANGILTGNLELPIVDAEGKRNFVARTCALHGLQKSEIMAVGDGANDIPMLALAGTAVGFNPKEILKSHIQKSISSHHELVSLLGK